MVRNLYRFYLYVVFIALLIFAAVAVGQFLATVLSFTPLRGSYGTTPSQAVVLQSTIFALVSLVIAGALGGLHYWLIRRDLHNDPAAGTSAIRSFFLNICEAIGISLAVPFVGFMMLATRAQSPEDNIVFATAFALPTLALVLILEVERRRTQTRSREALIFQRFHVYAILVILLIYLTFSWLSAVRPLVDGLFFAGRAAREVCTGPNILCPIYNFPLLISSILWFVAWFVGYGLLVSADKATLLRLILQGTGLAYGIGLILFGLQQGIEVLLFFPFNVSVALKDVLGAYNASYDFVSPLTLGILIVALFSWWLRLAAQQGLIKRNVLVLTEYAIAGVLAAAAFWWGGGNLLYDLFQSMTPVPSAPDVRSWASSLAFALVGISYIGFDLFLRRQNRIEPVSVAGPRRGFVFAMLGGGILSLAIGGATALYAWATALFGTPISNWQQVAHMGLAACLIGAFLTGAYLWAARHESLFSGLGKRSPTEVTLSPTTPGQPMSALGVEGI
ncbi:MAG TPA: hypothetical protein VFB12_19155, partial [Ktedonobacteraceae bacterium]|nr:hypothetical protein [Ktedonobacteraceae bacterium]